MKRSGILMTMLLVAGLLLAGCTIQPAVPATDADGAATEATAEGATVGTVTDTVTDTVAGDAETITSTAPASDDTASAEATVEGAAAVTTTTSVVTTTVTTVTQGAAVSETATVTATGGATSTDALLLPTPTPAAALTVTGALTTPATLTATTAATTVITDAAAGTILQVINSTPGLETLAAALTASGMATGLDEAGPLTFFAPNNDAFAAIPADQLDALLADPATLAPILQYHIVIDNVSQAGLGTLGAALSSSGLPITMTVQADGSLLVNEATLVQGDIAAANGVIHIIDGVLAPPAE